MDGVASAHWNELTYRRRQEYFDTDGDVWTAETSDLYDKYGPVSGTGSSQQLKRKNDEAWRAFFENLTDYHNGNLEEKPSPPGYWGNREDGYDLRGVVRNDQYEFTWRKNRSTLEFTVGDNLKEKYGLGSREKLRIEVRGKPRWTGKDNRLELTFDDNADGFRVHWTVTPQPTDIDQVRQSTFTHTPSGNTTKHAAIDVGANNTLTILTEDGEAAVFHARPEFQWFVHAREEIAHQQSLLPEDVYTSTRIRGMYATMYGRRDHHRDASVKQAADWLLDNGVTSVYVGNLKDVLSTHWKADVNEKTHAFWSHGQLRKRIDHTFELAGIDVDYVNEYNTSSECPHCGSESVERDGDALACLDCDVLVHSDVAGAGNILANETTVDTSIFFRPMARPAGPHPGRAGRVTLTHFEWNDHEWIPRSEGTFGSFDQQGSANLESSTLAPTGCGDHGGIPRL